MSNKKKKKKGRKKPSGAGRPPGGPKAQAAAAGTGAGIAGAANVVGGETAAAGEAGRGQRPRSGTDRRAIALQRRQAAQRRRKLKFAGIGVLVIALIAGLVAFRVIQNRQAMSAHMELAAAANCGEIQRFRNLGRGHVDAPVQYDMMPPVGGDHAPSTVPAGVFGEPFSFDSTTSPNVYQAVHSLEHGYVIVWHNDLEEEELDELERELRGERKVIVAPFDLEDGRMALTAWGRKQVCDDPDPQAASSFVELFREATAPEPEGQ